MDNIEAVTKDMAVVPVVPEYIERLMSVGLNGFKACHGVKDIRIHSIVKDLHDGRFLFIISSPSVFEYVSMKRILEEDLDIKKVLILVSSNNMVVELNLPVVDLVFEDLQDGERLIDPVWDQDNGDQNAPDCDGGCSNCGGMHQSYEEDDEEEIDGELEKDPDDYLPGFEGDPDDWKLT